MSDDLQASGAAATSSALSKDLATASGAVHGAQSAAQLAGVSSSGLNAAGQAVDLAQSASKVDGSAASLLGAAQPATGLASALGASSPTVQAASQAAEVVESARAAGLVGSGSAAATPAAMAGAADAPAGPILYKIGPALTAPQLNQDITRQRLWPQDAPSDFDDQRRLFRLYSKLPEEKRLFVHTLEGHEALNEPFEFRLELVSRSDAIELKELMGKPLAVGIRQNDGSERLVSGYVSEFSIRRNDVKGWAVYAARLVPWTHILTLNRDSRCFQRRTVREIVETLFDAYGPAAKYEFRLRDTYEPHDFIVQYQQNDWDFICHLIEREGWATTYEHALDGQKLVITDDTVSRGYCPPLPVYPTIEFNGGDRMLPHNRVTELHAVREMQPTQFTLDTFDYKSPRTPRQAQVPINAEQGDVPDVEVFDGTPGYAYKNSKDGERYAQLRIEERATRAKRFEGRSDCPDLRPGGTTVLTSHPQFDGKERLLILRVEHEGRNDVFMDGEENAQGKVEQGAAAYVNAFHCMRQSVPYRPPLKHPRAVIPGTQTAIVTGPPGHEIWTNEHGCVTVRFHWDRRARFDNSSSSWIRVAQSWAGAGWGTVSIPRVGQEVLVGFMEGHPERPVVLGSLYNRDQPPPYPLPAGAHMMGFKSNSTPGGGGHSEMVIHDSKGQELINLHAQKDMVTTVLNDKTTTVMQNHTVTVNGDLHKVEVPQGAQTNVVHKEIVQVSQTQHILLQAQTAIVLKVGESTLSMDKDGNISLQGVHIVVNGKKQTDINPG